MSDDEAQAAITRVVHSIQADLQKMGKETDAQLLNKLDFSRFNEQGELVLAASSKFYVDQIRAKGYLRQVEENIGVSLSTDIDIKQISAKKNDRTPQGKSVEIATPSAGRPTVPKNTDLSDEFTFDRFVIGNNAYAYNAAKAVASNPGHNYNPLLIYGGVGLGKTHLMQAIGNAVSDPNIKVIYVTAENFTNEFIASVTLGEKKGPSAFRKKYREADLLLIDDIHLFSDKAVDTQTELFNTFNDLYGSKRGMVFTCDRPLSELKNFNERMRTRFGMGLTTNLDIPTYEVRLAILRKALTFQKTNLTENILEFIAQNVASNVREMKSVLHAVIGYIELTKKPATLDIAKKFIMDTMNQAKDSRITIQQVQKCIAEHYEISIKDLKSTKRTKTIAQARHLAMYIAKELTGETNTEIGSEFGGRDHSTVVHSLDTIRNQCLTDGNYEELVQTLSRQIREGTLL